jgi:hypothetical protein
MEFVSYPILRTTYTTEKYKNFTYTNDKGAE